MSYVTSSLTAMAALGLAGVSTQANASLVTVDFNYPFNTNSDVTLDGVTPFSVSTTPLVMNKVTQNFGTLSGGFIASTGANGTDTVDPSLSYSAMSVVTGTNAVSKTPLQNGTGFINLAFDDAGGHELFGYATLDGTGGLASITYATAAIPEPSTWALLIAGAGVLGVATRRRRRQGLALAA